MSEALDEISSVKFRMAKRSGYDVVDVDSFLDRIEEQVSALVAENRQLRREVERLGGQPPG